MFTVRHSWPSPATFLSPRLPLEQAPSYRDDEHLYHVHSISVKISGPLLVSVKVSLSSPGPVHICIDPYLPFRFRVLLFLRDIVHVYQRVHVRDISSVQQRFHVLLGHLRTSSPMSQGHGGMGTASVRNGPCDGSRAMTHSTAHSTHSQFPCLHAPNPDSLHVPCPLHIFFPILYSPISFLQRPYIQLSDPRLETFINSSMSLRTITSLRKVAPTVPVDPWNHVYNNLKLVQCP